MTTTTTTTLDTYFPEPRRLHIAGKQVNVEKLKSKQLQPFARAVGPIIDSLTTKSLVGHIADHGDKIIEAVSVATGETVEWLNELDADDFVRIAAEVIEYNFDFFKHRVIPILADVLVRLELVMTRGETPSQSSFQEDSPGATAKI